MWLVEAQWTVLDRPDRKPLIKRWKLNPLWGQCVAHLFDNASVHSGVRTSNKSKDTKYYGNLEAHNPYTVETRVDAHDTSVPSKLLD